MGYHGNVLVEPTSGYCIYIIYITLITYIYNVYTQNHGQYVYIYVPWSSYVGFMVLSLWSSITCQEFPVPSWVFVNPFLNGFF